MQEENTLIEDELELSIEDCPLTDQLIATAVKIGIGLAITLTAAAITGAIQEKVDDVVVGRRVNIIEDEYSEWHKMTTELDI